MATKATKAKIYNEALARVSAVPPSEGYPSAAVQGMGELAIKLAHGALSEAAVYALSQLSLLPEDFDASGRWVRYEKTMGGLAAKTKRFEEEEAPIIERIKQLIALSAEGGGLAGVLNAVQDLAHATARYTLDTIQVRQPPEHVLTQMLRAAKTSAETEARKLRFVTGCKEVAEELNAGKKAPAKLKAFPAKPKAAPAKAAKKPPKSA